MFRQVQFVFLSLSIYVLCYGNPQESEQSKGVEKRISMDREETNQLLQSVFPNRTHDIKMLQFTENHRKEIQEQINADIEEEERNKKKEKSAFLEFLAYYWKVVLALFACGLIIGTAVYCRMVEKRDKRNNGEESIELASQ